MRYFIYESEHILRGDSTTVEIFIDGKWVKKVGHESIDTLIEFTLCDLEEVTESQAKLFLI
jgi:hypothetical protein